MVNPFTHFSSLIPPNERMVSIPLAGIIHLESFET